MKYLFSNDLWEFTKTRESHFTISFKVYQFMISLIITDGMIVQIFKIIKPFLRMTVDFDVIYIEIRIQRNHSDRKMH